MIFYQLELVAGATCLGGGHLLTPDWTLGWEHFLLRCENWLKMAWNGFHLLNFELPVEQDLAYLGRFQVLGATCLGGGCLPTLGLTLGCEKLPHKTPLDPFAGSKLAIIIFQPIGLTFKADLGHFWPSYISEIWFLCSFETLTDLRCLELAKIDILDVKICLTWEN